MKVIVKILIIIKQCKTKLLIILIVMNFILRIKLWFAQIIRRKIVLAILFYAKICTCQTVFNVRIRMTNTFSWTWTIYQMENFSGAGFTLYHLSKMNHFYLNSTQSQLLVVFLVLQLEIFAKQRIGRLLVMYGMSGCQSKLKEAFNFLILMSKAYNKH